MLTGIPTWYRDGGRIGKTELEDLYLTMVRKAVSPETTDRQTEAG